MQAVLCFSPNLISFAPAKPLLPKLSPPSLPSRCSSIKATAVAQETSVVDYSSSFSVFPAEACETVGGEACSVDMYPEAKLKQESRTRNIAPESIDREYLQYDDPKSVLPGEACDVLGGEFCEQPYQRGVY